MPALGLLGALVCARALLLDPDPARRPLPPPPAAPKGPEAEVPPPPGRPARDPALDLPPLAGAWREAILQGRRDQVVALARSLRAASDGRAQLLLLARDGHERVRAYALTELARRRDPDLRELFQRAEGDPSPHVRESARHGLALLAGPR